VSPPTPDEMADLELAAGFDQAADDPESVFGPECPECGMDGGEHYRSCRWHRNGLT
jgi:hypothetical protein